MGLGEGQRVVEGRERGVGGGGRDRGGGGVTEWWGVEGQRGEGQRGWGEGQRGDGGRDRGVGGGKGAAHILHTYRSSRLHVKL